MRLDLRIWGWWGRRIFLWVTHYKDTGVGLSCSCPSHHIERLEASHAALRTSVGSKMGNNSRESMKTTNPQGKKG